MSQWGQRIVKISLYTSMVRPIALSVHLQLSSAHLRLSLSLESRSLLSIFSSISVPLRFTVPVPATGRRSWPSSSTQLTSRIKVRHHFYLLFRLTEMFLDSCLISQGDQTFPHFSTNPNNLTKAEIIFYWQIILLVLYLGLAGTSIILHRLEKEVSSPSLNILR